MTSLTVQRIAQIRHFTRKGREAGDMTMEEWNELLTLAQTALRAKPPEESLQAAIATVLEGFEKGIFVRSTEGDAAPDWSVRLIRYVSALAKLTEYAGSTRGTNG